MRKTLWMSEACRSRQTVELGARPSTPRLVNLLRPCSSTRVRPLNRCDDYLRLMEHTGDKRKGFGPSSFPGVRRDRSRGLMSTFSLQNVCAASRRSLIQTVRRMDSGESSKTIRAWWCRDTPPLLAQALAGAW